MQNFITNSSQETMEIAEVLAKRLKGGEVIVLDGDLGAGKTVFAKGLAKGLGITDIITSPTFTILNEYPSSPSFFHFDMYRIEDSSELIELGFDEYIGNPRIVCAIEWAQRVPSLIPEHHIHITISKIDDNTRELIIEGATI